MGLARAAALAPAWSGPAYLLAGMPFLLHRLGYLPAGPGAPGRERDEAAIAEWRTVTWAKVRG